MIRMMEERNVKSLVLREGVVYLGDKDYKILGTVAYPMIIRINAVKPKSVIISELHRYPRPPEISIEFEGLAVCKIEDRIMKCEVK